MQAVPNNINSKFVVMLFTRGGVGDFRGCGDGPLGDKSDCVVLFLWQWLEILNWGKGWGNGSQSDLKCQNKEQTKHKQKNKNKNKKHEQQKPTNQTTNKTKHTHKKKEQVCVILLNICLVD